MKKIVKRLAIISASKPWAVIGVALLLSLLAIQAAIKLPVYTSRQALLPQNTEVAARLNRFLETFGAASDLVVALENAPRETMEAFATELATRLRTQPEIAQATERLDTDFFLQHAYLMMPASQLKGLESLLLDHQKAPIKPLSALLVEAQEALKNPPSSKDLSLQESLSRLDALNATLAEWQRWLEQPEPPTDLAMPALLKALGAEQLGNGYFASRTGDLLFLFVHARDPSENRESLAPFNQRILQVTDELQRTFRNRGQQPPEVILTGLPAIEYEEYLDIEKDIRLVIWSAAILIAALILIVVRSMRWALAIFIPMGLGALWSLGFAYLAVGHLTIITSSFLAILFGLGADYGIFTTSQIQESRRSGTPLIEAIGQGIAEAFPAVMTAGIASLLIFSALATVEFPGFAELGLIAAGGVLLILISTCIVQPAVYALFPPKIKINVERVHQKALKGAFWPPIAWILVILSIVGALFGLRAGLSIPFDYDVLSLLPKDSRAAQYQRRMVTDTDYQSEVVIFTAKTIDDLRRITEAASHLPSLAKVQSITALFPEDAQDHLETAQRIGLIADQKNLRLTLEAYERHPLTKADLKTLSALLKAALDQLDLLEEQAFSAGQTSLVEKLETARSHLEALLEDVTEHPEVSLERTNRLFKSVFIKLHEGLSLIASWRAAVPLSPKDLPASLRDRFVAPDGTMAAYGFPAKSVYDPQNLDQLMAEVYRVDPSATGFPSTHQVFSKAVVDSFTRGTLLATIVCLLWLTIILRRPKAIILAALPLVIGGGWMLGLMALAGLRYNYANIIALPLVIALAVDYGVWFSHRWHSLQPLSPLAITLNAGKVIALAAGTEMAGLGAITLAKYRGVSGLGMDITIGLVSCLVATLLVAPAIGQLLNRPQKDI